MEWGERPDKQNERDLREKKEGPKVHHRRRCRCAASDYESASKRRRDDDDVLNRVAHQVQDIMGWTVEVELAKVSANFYNR